MRSSARWLLPVAGFCALGFLLGEPLVEGRNANANLFAVYFKDPFLAYVYLGSVPFFAALYQAFKALGSPAEAARAARTMRRCGWAFLAFIGGAAAIVLAVGEERPAGLFMCLLAALVAGAVVAGASALERRAHLLN